MPAPQYIYKILPASTPPPSSLPIALPVSSLDQNDGFIHLSTPTQLLSTLNRFFSSDNSVYILRIPYAPQKDAGVVKWEFTDGRVAKEGEEEAFPHLYNGLKVGREEVDLVGHWERVGESWTSEGWPFEEDVPGAKA